MTCKLYQLIGIEGGRGSIEYGEILDDCDSKTISTLQAINYLSSHIASLCGEKLDMKEVINISLIIGDLAELGVATNKIAHNIQLDIGLK
ncbi:hypothetical protein QF02_003917 [Salmonella enterica subsp. enterica]|nr:hypothetical protein [Salmonella enterica subsp. enterica serovar Lexington]